MLEPARHTSGQEYAPANVYDELFSDEFGTSWIIKSDRTPTPTDAVKVVEALEGPNDYTCRTVRGRVEWRDVEGWWFHLDEAGPYEVWQVEG